jgi:hypothetical protein
VFDKESRLAVSYETTCSQRVMIEIDCGPEAMAMNAIM